MTPFDPTALLVMLLAFYPVVGAAALSRARSERPEYFAGGRLFGSKGDKLLLPDGRAFDLIFASGGPASGQRWQVIEATGGGGSELFPLEPGPLTPIDEEDAPAPVQTNEFERLVAGGLDDLGASDGVLRSAGQTLAEHAQDAIGLDAGAPELDDVERVASEIDRSRDADEFAGIIGETNGVDGAVASTQSDYDEAPPDVQLPTEPGMPTFPEDGGVQPLPPQPGPQPHDE